MIVVGPGLLVIIAFIVMIIGAMTIVLAISHKGSVGTTVSNIIAQALGILLTVAGFVGMLAGLILQGSR